MAAQPGVRESGAMTENAETIGNGTTVKRLERSRSDRMLAGVAGGLARYFDVHPALFRVGFVVLTLLGGSGVIIYVAAALVIPKEGETDSFASAILRERRSRPWPLIGLALVAFALVTLLSRATLWPHGDAWVPLLLAGGAILWMSRHGGKAIAIAVGTTLAVILAAIAVFATVFHVHLERGVGDRSYFVGPAQNVDSSYKLSVGHLTLDLADARLPVGETKVDTRVDVGALTVTVPSDVAVRVHGAAQLGSVQVLGRADDGRHADASVAQTGRRVLVLDANVGVGQVRVVRAVR
jgi:phage shock protein PspC (stress-responsive transcriptional regulator)